MYESPKHRKDQQSGEPRDATTTAAAAAVSSQYGSTSLSTSFTTTHSTTTVRTKGASMTQRSPLSQPQQPLQQQQQQQRQVFNSNVNTKYNYQSTTRVNSNKSHPDVGLRKSSSFDVTDLLNTVTTNSEQFFDAHEHQQQQQQRPSSADSSASTLSSIHPQTPPRIPSSSTPTLQQQHQQRTLYFPSHYPTAATTSNTMNRREQMTQHGRQSSYHKSPTSYYRKSDRYTEYPVPPMTAVVSSSQNQSTTAYAQTFVLSLAFLSIWSPQNLMAPNLTQMAQEFHFSAEQRDLYLGANIAFATGVLSLPLSALLGFYADLASSRKQLFAFTVCMGGISSIGTGCSTTYLQLYLYRFICGGFMSGSVPIAFSMLGDLFDAKDRNTASSGLTAMMGAGILFGQVVAGTVGASHGWNVPFVWSGVCSIACSVMVLFYVQEPVRGSKEKVLQDMIANGTHYDKKLSYNGFLSSMTENKTNVILMIQGFTTNIPWGIIFTFLNDYLSQEQGLSVPASTLLVFWFGLGSALGGVLGGYIGMQAMILRRSLLPLCMSVATALGTVPFLGLLNLNLLNQPIYIAIALAFTGGCIANVPSVNVRPCLLNVNPPETRGVVMTAANLMINVARGAGPSLITFSQAVFNVSRRDSFNFAIIIFWSLSALLLLILMKTLPSDQDKMDEELAQYAKLKMNSTITKQQQQPKELSPPLLPHLSEEEHSVLHNGGQQQQQHNVVVNEDDDDDMTPFLSIRDDDDDDDVDDEDDATTSSFGSSNESLQDLDRLQPPQQQQQTYYTNNTNTEDGTIDQDSIVSSIEERMQSFDATAAHESLKFIGDALREIGEEFNQFRRQTSPSHPILLSAASSGSAAAAAGGGGGGIVGGSSSSREDVIWDTPTYLNTSLTYSPERMYGTNTTNVNHLYSPRQQQQQEQDDEEDDDEEANHET